MLGLDNDLKMEFSAYYHQLQNLTIPPAALLFNSISSERNVLLRQGKKLANKLNLNALQRYCLNHQADQAGSLSESPPLLHDEEEFHPLRDTLAAVSLFLGFLMLLFGLLMNGPYGGLEARLLIGLGGAALTSVALCHYSGCSLSHACTRLCVPNLDKLHEKLRAFNHDVREHREMLSKFESTDTMHREDISITMEQNESLYIAYQAVLDRERSLSIQVQAPDNQDQDRSPERYWCARQESNL